MSSPTVASAVCILALFVAIVLSTVALAPLSLRLIDHLANAVRKPSRTSGLHRRPPPGVRWRRKRAPIAFDKRSGSMPADHPYRDRRSIAWLRKHWHGSMRHPALDPTRAVACASCLSSYPVTTSACPISTSAHRQRVGPASALRQSRQLHSGGGIRSGQSFVLRASQVRTSLATPRLDRRLPPRRQSSVHVASMATIARARSEPMSSRSMTASR